MTITETDYETVVRYCPKLTDLEIQGLARSTVYAEQAYDRNPSQWEADVRNAFARNLEQQAVLRGEWVRVVDPGNTVFKRENSFEGYGRSAARDSLLGPDGIPFVWGSPITTHEVGPYQIVEYLSRQAGNVPDGEWAERTDGTGRKVSFSCFIDHRAIGRSTATLDAALVYCIAYAHEGPNSRAASYFFRMVDGTEVV